MGSSLFYNILPSAFSTRKFHRFIYC